MLRPRSLRPALVVAAAALAGPAVLAGASGQPATAAVVDDDSPLVVTIDSLTPAVVPRSGQVRLTGSVTNRDDETWERINLYPIVGSEPMTTPAALAEAAAVPATEDVGDRVLSVVDTVEELAPGESAQFSLRLPRSQVPATEGGVYWFGVHALGESPDGRDTVADGRARTFLPLVPRATRGRVRTAVVVPLRRSLARESDGSMADVEGWTRTLGTDGALRSLVDLGASAGDRPVTWLVDPALVDAVRRLADGNPPRSLAPEPDTRPLDPTGSPSGGASPSGDGTPTSTSSDGDGDEDGDEDDEDTEGEDTEGTGPEHRPTPEEAAAAQVATAWLARFSEAVEGDEVLALPYGDLDVAAAVAEDPDLLARARTRAAEATSTWEVATTPAVGSPSGWLDPAALSALEPGQTVLVSDRVLGPDAPAVARTAGHRLVATSSGAAAGGPGPDDPLATVALRQRVLAEAALRLLTPGRRPLVVQLPAGWTPRSTTGFFDALDQDWIEQTTVADAADRAGTAVPAEDLAYPARQERRRIQAEGVASALELVRSGEVLQHVLRDGGGVAAEVADEALATLSYSARDRPTVARLAAEASRRWIEERLASITIEAPPGVALSSANGRFGATVVNGLDQPVEVAIRAETTDAGAIAIEGPETVEVPAGSRASVLLDATTREPGVHRVRLVLTDHTEDPDDRPTPLGSSDELPIRSIQASAVIWLIIAAGGVLLLGAVVLRVVRRVRSARREGAPA